MLGSSSELKYAAASTAELQKGATAIFIAGFEKKKKQPRTGCCIKQ